VADTHWLRADVDEHLWLAAREAGAEVHQGAEVVDLEIGRSVEITWTEAGGRKISVHGDEGAGAHVKIIDVDPGSDEFMQVIGSFQVPNGASAHNIMAFGDRAYVAWYQNGVRVLDLSDPTQPRQVAHYNTWTPVSGEVSLFEGTLGIDVDLAQGLIYAADTQRGLVVLRIDE